MNYILTEKNQITLDTCLKAFEKTHLNNKRKAINCNIKLFSEIKNEYRLKNNCRLNWEQDFYSNFDKSAAIIYNYLQYIHKAEWFDFTQEELKHFNQ
jgi:hypothetical protein